MTTLKVGVREAQALRVKFGEPVFVRALLGSAKQQTKATAKHVWNEDLLLDVADDLASILRLELHTPAGLFAKAAVNLQELEDPTETLVLPLTNAAGTTSSRDGTLKVQLGLEGVDDAIPTSKSAQDLCKTMGSRPPPIQPPARPPPTAAAPAGPPAASPGPAPGVVVQVLQAVGVTAEGNCHVAITCGSLTKKTAPKDSAALVWNESLQFGVPAEPPLEISVELFDDVDTRGEGSVVLEHVSPAPVEYSIDLFRMEWRERTNAGQVKVLVHKTQSPKVEASRTPELPDCASTGALSSLSGSSTSSRTDLFRLGRARQSPSDIHISVLVMKANDLDPSHGEVFVKFTHRDVSATTTPRDAQEPVWNEVLKVVLPADCAELLVELCGADGPKGEGTIPAAQFTDEPLLSLDLHTFFWHRRIKVATLQLSLQRLPSDVVRCRTPSQGELWEIASHLGLPSGQPLSPRHQTRSKSSESNLLNAPEFSKEQPSTVPWIIVTTPEDNDSAAPLLVNSVLHVEVQDIAGLKRPVYHWLYVKVAYAKHTRKTQAMSLLDGDAKADLLPFHETLVFAFAGHLPLHFTVVDIIQNVEVASAVLNPSRLEFANSSHNIPLTPAGGGEPLGALLNVALQLVSKQQKAPPRRPSRDPLVAEMDLRNKDQKITELEVRMDHLNGELKRYRELERVMAPLQEELKQKMATINELRRLVASGEPPSMSVLLVTIGHGADLPATCNVHVRLQLGEQVVKSAVRDNAEWDEALTVEFDSAEYVRGWTEEHTLLVQIFERDTCLGAGTVELRSLSLVDDGPPVQLALPLQQEFWHKLEDCGTLHLAVALRLRHRRPAFMRNMSNLPRLNVMVMSGVDLKAVDDLHVQLIFDEQVKKTQVLDETYHPVWNETLTFFINPEDPCEELHVEAYSSDTCIGKGTVILSELDDEDGEDPILEVQMFQVFLHHRTPAGAVRVQIGIHMSTYNAVMESRRERILKLEDTVLEREAEIEKLRQQLAVKNDRLGKLEQVVRTASVPLVASEEVVKTTCVFWFTVMEGRGLRVDDRLQYYVRVTFDGVSQRTQLAAGAHLQWDERLRFESDLETLDDELELTIFHDGRVSGSIGTGVCSISDLEFNEAFEDIEVPLAYDDQPAGTLRVRVQCLMGEGVEDVDAPDEATSHTDPSSDSPVEQPDGQGG